MLRKAVVIGICFVAIASCTDDTSQKEKQAELEAVTQKMQQERKQLELEKERESKRQAILSSIKQLEQQKDLLSQKMIGRQQKVSNLELQENQLESELRTFNGKVKSFMMDHKIAIVCMGAVGASLDENNQYSKDAKDIAGMATTVCAFAVLSDDEFRNEVFSVIDELVQADSYAKNLRSQVNAIRSQLNTEKELLEEEKSEASRLASDIQTYQSQLDV